MSKSHKRTALLKNLDGIRKNAEEDLAYFAKLVSPGRVYGDLHLDLFDFWTKDIRKDNQLALLPRGHQKSHCAAAKMAWYIIKDPCITILYISATAQLAEAQLFAIKNILESEIVQLLWPELINTDEGKRGRWTVGEIIIDHPLRKEEGVRDCTVIARGLTANITGLHADHVCLDDVVVPANAYTGEGREKVANMYSQLASIKNPGAGVTAVGTRYHPKDLYDTLLNLEYAIFSEDTDEYVGRDKVYEVMEEVVESQGVFLWPKTMRGDGKFFGFDRPTLEKIKAEYIDSTQFHAQYYNNPNDPDNARINRSKFQYYDRKHLNCDYGNWYFKDNRLNVYASIDFAFSLRLKSDYSAIVVVGIDKDKNVYVLDIERFKTDRIPIYFEKIIGLYDKWNFKKLRAEVSAAQVAIVRELKEGYIKPQGLALSVDEYRPMAKEGSKQERVASILEPRYDNQAIWHYKGGNCTLLEEELILAKPPHDDIKDALASVIDIAVSPKRYATKTKNQSNVIQYNRRFGGFGSSPV
jgi:hypothetical protein